LFGEPQEPGSGYSILHRTCWFVEVPVFVVRAVLAAGGDPMAKNHKGETPIATAIRRESFRSKKIVECYLEGGLSKIDEEFSRELKEELELEQKIETLSKSLSSEYSDIPVIVVGIAGATRSGKSSLAKSLSIHYETVSPVSQDTFLQWPIPRTNVNGTEYPNFEIPQVHDFFKIREAIQRSIYEAKIVASVRSKTIAYVFVEGFLLFCNHTQAREAAIIDLFDKKIFVEVSRDDCYSRRMATTRVSEEYFDHILWPCYLKYGQLPDVLKKSCLVLDSTTLSHEEMRNQAIKYVE
jgi:hypothetical protein